jgi:hypothetical protein
VGAIGTLVLAFTTAVLVAVGLAQIVSAREEAKRGRTLTACDRYDTDPVLDASLHKLAKADRDGLLETNPGEFRTDIASVLNYLDSLAVGIVQGLYIEEIIRDHNESIIKRHVSQYLALGRSRIFGIDEANYQKLTALCERWSRGQTYFRTRSSLFLRRRDPMMFGGPKA